MQVQNHLVVFGKRTKNRQIYLLLLVLHDGVLPIEQLPVDSECLVAYPYAQMYLAGISCI